MRTSIFYALVMLLSFSAAFAFDVDGDGKEGLPEAVHALQVVSAMAPATSTIVFIEPVGTAVENGTALIATLTSITDNGQDKPYLVKLQPGTYDLGSSTLSMKAYVDIEGTH